MHFCAADGVGETIPGDGVILVKRDGKLEVLGFVLLPQALKLGGGRGISLTAGV